MKMLIIALAGAAALWLTVPTLANEELASTEQDIQAAATDVSAKSRRHHVRRHHARRHHVRHDRGVHRGFSHSRHLGYARH
jgi:hypothetical protein